MISSSGEVSAAEDSEKQIWSHNEDNDETVVQLEQHHKDYLLERHGTLELEPMPSHDPNDPLNWPNIKKNIHLGLVAFHAMMTTFQAAAIVPAYGAMAEEFKRPISDISYLTSSQILVLGLAPLFLVPFMNKYGRRPFLLASAFGAMAFNIGSGFCTTYGQKLAMCILSAFFISPAGSIGSVVVTEISFSKERGKKTGWWALMLTLGSPCGPFIMGFVQKHAGTRWIAFTLAIVEFFLFIGYFFFGPETLYNRDGDVADEKTSWWRLRKLNSQKITFKKIASPFLIFTVLPSIVAILSQSFTFAFANVVLVVEMPQVFIPKFGLDPQQLGLQFIAIIIGSVLGELSSGPLSDWWMQRRIRSRGQKVIQDRLWLAYLGFVTIIVGLIAWGVALNKAKTYSVVPLVGEGITAFGNQVVTTILITFAVDVDSSRSSEIGILFNLVRSTWAFVAPFFLPLMFESLGYIKSAGLMAGLVAIYGIPIICLHVLGLRQNKVVA